MSIVLWLGLVTGTTPTDGPVATPETIAFTAILTLAWIGTLFRLPSYWRFDPEGQKSNELLPSPRRRAGLAFVRAFPSNTLSGGFFLAAAWSALGSGNLFNNHVLSVLIGFFAFCCLMSLLISITVWVYGRPKVFVPPKLRSLN